MKTKLKCNFSPELRLESAQLVVDQNYSIRQAAQAINVELPERFSLIEKLKKS